MIENYLLEQFIAFAEAGTLSKAAERLHISQPSLSRSMHKLEDEFGVALFNRSNSKISLNQNGQLAVKYARRALDANREMINQVTMFDRSQRTISVGACTPFPSRELLPVLQEHLPDKAISTEINDDNQLITGLKKHNFQIIILHQDPHDPKLFCQRFLQENLYISVPEDSPLASKKSVQLRELRDLRILIDGNVGFWRKIVLTELNEKNLLTQDNIDALGELVDASTLPVFNTDQLIARGYVPKGRVSIPINDAITHVTYWLTTLYDEQKKYRPIFNDVRGKTLKNAY